MADFYFSFDFESAGPNYATNGVNGIGVVVFDKDGNEVEVYETGIVLTNGRQMEPGCKQFFWDKNPEALKWIQDHDETPWVVASKIADLYKKYKGLGGKKNKIEWVAWPAAYDWGLLVNFMNEFDCSKTQIGFKATCASSMCDAYTTAAGLNNKPSLDDLGCPIENPHFPGSDARAQGKAFFVLKQKFAEMNKQ